MANDLPTGINGMTGTFSPGQPWNANLQQRFGTYTEFDAIRGFNRYVRGAADTIFYTPVIQRLRQLEQALRQQGTDALTAEDAGETRRLWTGCTNTQTSGANKKASPDRGWESLLGREGYSVSGMLTSLVSQSSVGGSLSSAASNLIGGLTGMAQVDFKHALREGMRTTWQLLRRFDKRGGGYDGFADQIPFMQRRFSENEDILLTRPEQFRRAGSKALYALFSELDRWAVESVARAKYAESLDAGMTKAQAIAATNDLLIKNFADRGKGQAPRIRISIEVGQAVRPVPARGAQPAAPLPGYGPGRGREKAVRAGAPVRAGRPVGRAGEKGAVRRRAAETEKGDGLSAPDLAVGISGARAPG